MHKLAVLAANLAASVVVARNGNSQGLRSLPTLPSFPQVYETADLKIRVVLVAGGLSNPWSMA
jgi:hypothetical protein